MAKIKRTSLTTVLVLCVRIVCGGEDDDSLESPVSRRPFQFVPPRDHLFGDWEGLRSQLESGKIDNALVLDCQIAINF